MHASLPKNLGSALQKLTFPLADLVGMNFELLRKFRDCALLLDGFNGHFHPEGCVEFSSRSGHRSQFETPPFCIQFFPTTSEEVVALDDVFRVQFVKVEGVRHDVSPDSGFSTFSASRQNNSYNSGTQFRICTFWSCSLNGALRSGCAGLPLKIAANCGPMASP